MANANAKVLADDILNWVKGTAFPAAPATLYVALLTAVPTKNDGTGLTEVSGSGYARQGIASTGWSAISQSADTIHDQISNSAAITFPAVTTTSYTVAGVAIYDALSGGNLLWYAAVTSQVVAVGNQYQIGAGSLVIEE
jgi:hypothetical protein